MKKLLTILAILLAGFFTTATAHEKQGHKYEKPIPIEEWMTKPFDSHSGSILLSGSTIDHGDYVITQTEEVYYFMGKEYEVYNVMYDDPTANMKIGVYGREYIAYTEDFIFFYECTKKGFGIRRALFNNSEVRDLYNEREYSKQTILCAEKKIDTLQALGLIAVYVPKLK